MQECSLIGENYREILVEDFVFKGNPVLHDIGTLYDVTVNQTDVVLDNQSSSYKWLKPEAWLELELSVFMKKVILGKINVNKKL